MFLGAHMSTAGGLHLSVERIRSVEGTALQVFTKNQRQWRCPRLAPKQADAFCKAIAQWGDYPLAAHGSYLINLASPDPDLRSRSINALSTELRRGERMGIPCLIIHPGAHMGAGTAQAIRRSARAIDRALARSGTSQITVLVETTAGAGTGLGGRFEELGAILDTVRSPERVGVCLDTCHVFAAGYDFRTPKTYRATFEQLDKIIGVERIGFFHLNDSKHGLGSRKDRHAHIGRGKIGESGFRLLLNDPRFARVGMVLETPKDESLKQDRMNLGKLRSLVRSAPPRTPRSM